MAGARIREFESYMPARQCGLWAACPDFRISHNFALPAGFGKRGAVPRLPEAAKGGSSGDILTVGNLLHEGHDPAPRIGTFNPHE
jgi:hypothetical protein